MTASSPPTSSARAVVRPVLAVSTAVFRNGKVLLAQRGARLGHGLWTLPGGRVEPGEALADAAAREVREEVGVDCAILGVAGALDIIHRDAGGALTAHFVVVCHAGLWRAGEAAIGPEAKDVGWFDPDTLAQGAVTLPMTEGLAGMVAAAWRLLP